MNMSTTTVPVGIPKGEAITKVHELLNGCYWLNTLETLQVYERSTDDHDGKFQPKIRVMIDKQGDVWVSTMGEKYGMAMMNDFRFRTHGGGGSSLRVRNAMLILAEAIRLDNIDRPEPA